MTSYESLINWHGDVVRSTLPIGNDDNHTNRGFYFSSSNAISPQGVVATETDCHMAQGYTWDRSSGTCYMPCPPLWRPEEINFTRCEKKPTTSALEIYNMIMGDAAASCADKNEAYKQALTTEDASRLALPPDCENPYAAPPDSGVFDPAASNGDTRKPEDAPSGVPYIPSPPSSYVPVEDPTSSWIDDLVGGATAPRSRLVITPEEIAALPKENEWGNLVDGTLAQMLKVHPTFVDVEPAYIIDCQRLIPNFLWECSITQAEFDLLDDDSKCSLCYSYQDFIYNNPANIKALRVMAPTITITRNAPTAVPVFSGCVAEAREAACINKKDDFGMPCVYQGGCKGACNCAKRDDWEPECDWICQIGTPFKNAWETSIDFLDPSNDNGLLQIVAGGAGKAVGNAVSSLSDGLGLTNILLIGGALVVVVVLIK